MSKEKEEFQRLLREVEQEIKSQPEYRSQAHRHLTMNYFMDHGVSQEEHDLWRESKMLHDMLSVAYRRLRSLNPHAERVQEMREEKEWKAQYEYTQAIDMTGKTEEELNSSHAMMYPALNREYLELTAAERYLMKTCGIEPNRRLKPTTRTYQKDKSTATQLANANPVLDYKQLCKELERAHCTMSAIQKAVDRSIAENYKKEDLPWAIKGCG